MVLDPLSALSLAGTVVQFIDFGSKLLSESCDIYRSATGTSPGNHDLEIVTKHLSRLSAELTKSPANARNGLLEETTEGDEAPEEDALVGLARACKEVADDLLSTVQQLKVEHGPHRKWRSFLQALKNIRGKEKVHSLRQRMDSLRMQLVLQLVTILSGQQSMVLASLEGLEKSSNSSMPQPGNTLALQHAKELGEILAAVQSLRDQVHDGHNSEKLRHLVSVMSDLVQTTTKRMRMQKARVFILNSLSYESMAVRESRIVKAHHETFRWIFQPQGLPPSDLRSRIRYTDWLEFRSGVYWISGKAGSGKSTLMKFLCKHPETMRILQRWAGDARLVTLNFFFWSAGTKMQRSLQGLLQSLLYELLGEFPSLIPTICPQRWSKEDVFPSRCGPWDIEELSQAIRRVVNHTHATTKFCLFIDGLDEYDGDLSEFITFLNDLKALPTLKLCLSSRPLNIFEDSFGSASVTKLYLQDLTREDISSYTRDILQGRLELVSSAGCSTNIDKIVEEITKKAQGVFLWVFLVVRSLSSGLSNGDTDATLYRRLRSFPSDLEIFFEHMFQAVDPMYRQQSSCLFQVALKSSKPRSLMVYSFLMEDDPDFAINLMAGSYRAEEAFRIASRAQRQLNARTQGLLEPQHPVPRVSEFQENRQFKDSFFNEVEFMHRTVRDFLLLKNMQEMLANYASPGFNTNATLCRALLAEFKTKIHEKMAPLNTTYFEVDDMLHLSRKAELQVGSSDRKMLEELSRVTHQFISSDSITANGSSPLWNVAAGMPAPEFLIRQAIDAGMAVYFKEIIDDPLTNISIHGHKLLKQALDSLSRLKSGKNIASDGVVDIVHQLLAYGVELHGDNPRKSTYSAWAHLFSLHPEMCSTAVGLQTWNQLLETFLLFGANPNYRSAGVPVWVSYLRQVLSQRPLRKRQDVLDHSILRTLTRLLEHGADSNQTCHLHLSSDETILEYFIRDFESCSNPSHLHFKVLELMVDHGANLEALISADPGYKDITASEFMRELFKKVGQRSPPNSSQSSDEHADGQDRGLHAPFISRLSLQDDYGAEESGPEDDWVVVTRTTSLLHREPPLSRGITPTRIGSEALKAVSCLKGYAYEYAKGNWRKGAG